MTDQQREAAARELCRLRGVDPDEKCSEALHGIMVKPGTIPAATLTLTMPGHNTLTYPRWHGAAREILAFEQMQAAIAVGLAHGDPAGKPLDLKSDSYGR